jgi:hypothetical protein
MPVILTAWESEIWRIAAQGQLRQIVRDPHLKNNQSKMDWRCPQVVEHLLSSPKLSSNPNLMRKKRKEKQSLHVFTINVCISVFTLLLAIHIHCYILKWISYREYNWLNYVFSFYSILSISAF